MFEKKLVNTQTKLDEIKVDFLKGMLNDGSLSNPANSKLHSPNFLNQIYQYPEMMESIHPF